MKWNFAEVEFRLNYNRQFQFHLYSNTHCSILEYLVNAITQVFQIGS